MICQNCNKQRATEKHHKFSQTKKNKKNFPKLIHHPDNIQYLCYSCHHDKSLLKWDEVDFCLHFDIDPISDTAKGLWNRYEISGQLEIFKKNKKRV